MSSGYMPQLDLSLGKPLWACCGLLAFHVFHILLSRTLISSAIVEVAEASQTLMIDNFYVSRPGDI